MNSRGMELSINMIVVMVLGLAMLGIGISIFSSAFDKTVELKENVDSQTQARLNALLDDGSIIVIPKKSADIKRGEIAEFSMGITNINTEPTNFKVYITYGGSSAYPLGKGCYPSITSGCDPFNPRKIFVHKFKNDVCPSIDSKNCGDAWVRQLPDNFEFELDPNNRKLIPFGIEVPKTGDVATGQYVFNVDVCIPDDSGDCVFNNPSRCSTTKSCQLTAASRYDARYQVIVNI